MLRSTSHTVLVIDDDDDTRHLVAEALTTVLGLRVNGAGDGQAGIEAISESPPDLILLDLKMPRLDGFGVLHWLKSSPCTATIPVLALTAAANDASLRALERSCDGTVCKPFDLDDLIASVRPFVATPAAPPADLVAGGGS